MKERTTFQKVSEFYTGTAVIVFNTLILIILINIILGLFFYVKDEKRTEQEAELKQIDLSEMTEFFTEDGAPVPTSHINRYAIDRFDYKGCEKDYSPKEAYQVLVDFQQMFHKGGMVYQPWVQFSEPLYKSQYLNILPDSVGIPMRLTSNPKHDKSKELYHIFTFGGSTTFGYYVNDSDTWSSRLSNILNQEPEFQNQVHVSNYGRGYYEPSQELILFIELIKAGHRPSMVIFMDGVNKGADTDHPVLTEDFVNRYYAVQFDAKYATDSSWIHQLSFIPMVRAMRSVRNRIQNTKRDTLETIKVEYAKNTQQPLRMKANRFEHCKNMVKKICELYDIPCIFFSQPDTYQKYDLDLFRQTSITAKTQKENQKLFYKPYYQRNPDVIRLDTLFETYGHRKAVIDDCHYSPEFNQFLAQKVTDFIDIQSLKSHPYQYNDEERSGSNHKISETIYRLVNLEKWESPTMKGQD